MPGMRPTTERFQVDRVDRSGQVEDMRLYWLDALLEREQTVRSLCKQQNIYQDQPKVITVFGATGNIGPYLCKYLSEKCPKTEIRALHFTSPPHEMWANLPNVKAVKCDMNSKDDMRKALEGADRVFLLTRSNEDSSDRELPAIDVMVELGTVQHVVKMGTSSGITYPESEVGFGRHHYSIQKKLEASGLSWSLIQANFAMANAAASAAPTLNMGFVALPWPEGCQVSISAPQDVAEVAGIILADPAAPLIYGKRRIFVHGKERFDGEAFVKAIADSLPGNKTLKFQRMGFDEWEQMITPIIGPWMAASIKGVYKNLALPTQQMDNVAEFEAMTGREPTTFAEYLKEFSMQDAADRFPALRG
eukprot:Clim_evm78s207 gene=Clim_evmTU78s207